MHLDDKDLLIILAALVVVFLPWCVGVIYIAGLLF